MKWRGGGRMDKGKTIYLYKLKERNAEGNRKRGREKIVKNGRSRRKI